MTVPRASILPASLQFTSAEEERLFNEDAYPSWLRQATIGGIVALFFNNAFLLMDYMIGPKVFEVGVHIRFFLCTGFGLLVNMLGIATLRHWINPPRLMQEAFVVSGSVMAGLSILLVAALSPIQGTLWGIVYHAGLVPVMVFGTVMMRLRFRAVCVLNGATLLMHWTALALSPALPQAMVLPIMLTVAAPALFMLTFSYKFEVDERLRFSQKRRAARLRHELQAKREALEQASIRDPLTGVLNRRGFAAAMDALVSQTGQGHEAGYALALVDVDHFKLYNDGHGHPAGDACLCAVSQALNMEVALLNGTLARWGGEEFVIALPLARDTDPLSWGQRLCSAVAAAAIPHRYSATSAVVTVSVGVARSGQLGHHTTWNDVLAQADSALYQAKRAGRNGACLA